jgi:hypothetical protein
MQWARIANRFLTRWLISRATVAMKVKVDMSAFRPRVIRDVQIYYAAKMAAANEYMLKASN